MEALISLIYGIFLVITKKIIKDDHLQGAVMTGTLKWIPLATIKMPEGIFKSGWGKSTQAAQMGDGVMVQVTHQTWTSRAGIGENVITTDLQFIDGARLVRAEDGTYSIEKKT